MERRHELVQLGDIDTGMQFVQLGNGQGLWMNKKFSDDKIGENFNGKIDSVRGPPSAPIGFGVAALSNEGGAPYAAKRLLKNQQEVFNINQLFSQLKTSKEKNLNQRSFQKTFNTEKKLEKKESELLMPPLTNSSLLV